MDKVLNIKIELEDVLVRMGANKYRTKINSELEEIISDSITCAQKIIQPKFALSIADKKIEGNKILLDNFLICSKDIFKLLKNSKKVYGIVATAGAAIDQKVDLLQNEKKTTVAYIYDSIGSVAVEQLMDNICNEIKKTAVTTIRFSPGYGDWAINNQKEFLKWLAADKIGVSLSETFQMSPRKTVSALVGIENHIK